MIIPNGTKAISSPYKKPSTAPKQNLAKDRRALEIFASLLRCIHGEFTILLHTLYEKRV